MVRNFPRPGDTGPDYSIDLLAFLVIVWLVVRSNINKLPMPTLFKTIAQDATYYFLVIFTSHFVFEMSLLLARVRISIRAPLSLCDLLKSRQPGIQLLPRW